MSLTKIHNIFLIGPMGAGKSSVGKQLARMTKKKFYDSDHEISTRSGVPIAWIFETEQESGFRLREKQVIEQLSQLNNIVLSTGGGCIVTPENCQYLKQRGLVVYLKVSLEEQLKRTRRKETRPLIDVPNPKEKLIELNAQREPLYTETADITFTTDNQTPLLLAKKIIQYLKNCKHSDNEK